MVGFDAGLEFEVAFEVVIFGEETVAAVAAEGLAGLVHRAEDGVAGEAFAGVEGAGALWAGLGDEFAGFSLEGCAFGAHVLLEAFYGFGGDDFAVFARVASGFIVQDGAFVEKVPLLVLV